MLEQFLNHIEHHALCQKSDTILLAVSGGIDSMVMLDLFASAGFSFGVAHVNFQLRGKESDDDEQFVRAVCEQKKIPFHSIRFNTAEYAQLNRLSIQLAARELRYAWFDELMQTHLYHRVATAHHLNDSVETSLMRWLHGSALHDLTGIPAKNGHIIRPLLFATRNAIDEYARMQSLPFREDSSNRLNIYPRNLIRNEVIPKLSEVNPRLEKTVAEGQQKLKADLELVTLAVQSLKEKFMPRTGNEILLKKEALASFESKGFVLWRLIHTYNFTLHLCEEVVAALDGQPGKHFLSPTHRLVVDRTDMIITEHRTLWDAVTIAEGQKTAGIGSWNLDIENYHSGPIPSGPYRAALDADKLSFPLTWRSWQPGDFFYPLGMEHRKKVSDFLIDNKIPQSSKPFVTVLESAGQIAWLVGHRIDNRFKITNETKRVILFTVYPYFI